MEYASSGIKGIDIRYGNLAWIENTYVKVIQVVRDWDGRTIDLVGIQDRFQTIRSDEKTLNAFSYYLGNKDLCDQQILAGEDTPVFKFRCEKQRNAYEAYMAPLQSGYLLLKGSTIAASLSSATPNQTAAKRRQLVETGSIEGDEVIRDIPFGARERTKMSSIVTGHPNSGADGRTDARWKAMRGPFGGQSLSKWAEQAQ